MFHRKCAKSNYRCCQYQAIWSSSKSANLTGTFVYHMNYKCCKKTALAESPGSSAISCESEVSIENSFPSASSTRSNSTPRTPCECKRLINIRHSVLYVGLPTKARISEDSRAKNVLTATVFFRDDVFTRTCDLQDINIVFGADLYCHKNCINSYILKHVRALKKVNSQEKFPTVSKKEVVFDNLVSEIDTDLRKGIGYPLSDIRDQCNQLLGTVDQTVFTSKEQKVLLINHYGENVSFSSSHNPSKSSPVFLCNISKEDIVETVRNSDRIRDKARAIRDILLKESDPLKDKFCDANDLSDACDDTKIPILEFYASCSMLIINISSRTKLMKKVSFLVPNAWRS